MLTQGFLETSGHAAAETKRRKTSWRSEQPEQPQRVLCTRAVSFSPQLLATPATQVPVGTLLTGCNDSSLLYPALARPMPDLAVDRH